MSKIIGWIAAGGGLVALVVAGLWLGQPEEPDDAPPSMHGFVVPVTLTTLERGFIEPSTQLSGTVRAARRARLGFDSSGIIASVDVLEGQAVGEGTVLARLVSGDEEYALASAEASLALAQRQADLLLAGERKEEKKRLFAVLEATRAESKLARLEVERGEKLIADRIIAQSEQDRRRAAFDAADKRRAAAEQSLERANAGARAEDIAIAQARVEEERARVAASKHALSKVELSAPWSGVIVQRSVSQGNYVSAGDPVFEIVDLENVEVHLEIPGRFAPRVGPDSRVLLTLSKSDNIRLERKLNATIPAADEAARSFRGIVRLEKDDDPGHFLKPGMFVEVELFLSRLENVLLVDTDAVLANEGGNFIVRAVQGGEGMEELLADIIPVRVQAESQGLSAIRSFETETPPLSVGDAIVLVGADNAFPGVALLPRDSAGSPAPGAQAADRGGASE